MSYLSNIITWVAFSSLFHIHLLANNGIKNNTSTSESGYVIQQNRIFKQLEPFYDIKEEDTPFPYADNNLKPPSLNEQQTRNEIEATFNKVVSENRFVQFLDENALIDLPIGIRTEIGALTYTILIDSLVLAPEGTLLFASMSFDAPGLGKIHFRGTGIRFSKSGGLSDGGNLELVGDYPFSLNPSNTQQLLIKGSEQQTYVEFDCHGFRQMSLDASVIFSRDQLLPEGADGKVDPNENVMAHFTTILSDWNDLILAVDFPRFQVTGLKDFSFEVQQAIVDLSDLRNAPAVVFPEGYQEASPYLQSGNPNLWRGVYINEVSVFLPPQFVSKTENGPQSRVSFNGYHLLIDDQGFSGMVTANNLIPIDKGKIANWDFSLEEVHLALVANEVQEAGMRGQINIPINEVRPSEDKEDRLFQYTALLLPGNEYLFNVTNPDIVNFALWKASEVTLKPSSYIEIELRDNRFYPCAHLSGEMTINAGLQDGSDAETDDNKNIKLAGIAFQDLEIQSVKPYVRVGSFSLGTKSSNMGGYPLTINKIGGGQSGDELFLEVDLTLALTGNDGGGFGAGGGVRFISEAIEEGDDLSYRYKDLEITRFAIDIDQGAFALSGNLNFYKADPVYGNGLNGTIDAIILKSNLKASAIFGTVDGMRYWYFDALVNLGTKAPIFPGIYLDEFGGGASYHMLRSDQAVASDLGMTASGLVYIPDRSAGLGFKAIAGLRGESEKLFNGDAVFEMTFRSGGGLRNINFRGNAFLLSTPPHHAAGEMLKQRVKILGRLAKQSGELNQDPNASEEIFGPPDMQGAQIYAGILVNFDFDNHTLHANLHAVINVAQGVITGGGQAVMHFTPDEWYIYIGRPEYANRFHLNLLGLARADAYFVMGSTVPDTPPPPENVAAILGGINLDYMSDLNAMADGQGIGFGASLRVDTGDKTFLIFYGRFQAGVGFDVMMRNYSGVTCAGRGTMGINGWYANGQAYAYFDGKVGVKVTLFGATKKVDILSISAAVLAQAKLPNPIWIKGVVGGQFNVLGGLVKGNCSFEVVIGEECEIQQGGSALEGVEVIAQLTPQNGIGDVDVFTSPQAVFNYELEKPYHTTGINNEQITFKIALDELNVSGPSGPVATDLIWNTDKTIAVLKPQEILPPQTNLDLLVTVSFQELKNGVWERSKANGEELVESQSLSFTTGEAPDYIPANNVAFSYPIRDMLNFYQDEHPKGYVVLNQGQAYLFEDPDFKQIVRFASGGQYHETPLSYNESVKEVAFSIPNGLQNEMIYRLTFVSVPKLQTNIEANVSTSEARITNEGVDASVRTRTATGMIKNYEEKQLYEAHFRTSRYNTFEDKVVSVNPSSGWRSPVVAGVHLIGSYIEGPEPFSIEEIFGKDGMNPLIRMEADLDGNQWYSNNIFPLLHQEYPLPGNIRIQSHVRDVSILGIVPVKATRLNQYPRNFHLRSSDIQTGNIGLGYCHGGFEYHLAKVMYYDYVNLKNQAAAYIDKTNSNNTTLINLVQSPRFPAIDQGDYFMDIKYHLPGKESVTTAYPHKIYNPIK